MPMKLKQILKKLNKKLFLLILLALMVVPFMVTVKANEDKEIDTSSFRESAYYQTLNRLLTTSQKIK